MLEVPPVPRVQWERQVLAEPLVYKAVLEIREPQELAVALALAA